MSEIVIPDWVKEKKESVTRDSALFEDYGPPWKVTECNEGMATIDTANCRFVITGPMCYITMPDNRRTTSPEKLAQYLCSVVNAMDAGYRKVASGSSRKTTSRKGAD